VVTASGVEMDPNLVDAATQFLRGVDAGSLAAEIPEMRSVEVPDDTVDLRRLLVALEDARAGFDRRFAEGLDGAVGRLTTAVREVRSADARPFMQGPPNPGRKP
jgi:hypothetical protein